MRYRAKRHIRNILPAKILGAALITLLFMLAGPASLQAQDDPGTEQSSKKEKPKKEKKEKPPKVKKEKAPKEKKAKKEKPAKEKKSGDGEKKKSKKKEKNPEDGDTEVGDTSGDPDDGAKKADGDLPDDPGPPGKPMDDDSTKAKLSSQTGQEVPCARYHSGNMEFIDKNYTGIRIKRKGKKEIHYNDNTGIKSVFTVEWTGDCEYNLVFKKANGKTRLRKGWKMECRIVQCYEEYYDCDCDLHGLIQYNSIRKAMTKSEIKAKNRREYEKLREEEAKASEAAKEATEAEKTDGAEEGGDAKSAKEKSKEEKKRERSKQKLNKKKEKGNKDKAPKEKKKKKDPKEPKKKKEKAAKPPKEKKEKPEKPPKEKKDKN